MKDKKFFFITGAPRSGTTLLDKLLSMVDGVQAHSQPFPLLLTFLKRKYLFSVGKKAAFPLNDVQFENFYNREDWIDFLNSYVITKYNCKDVFELMGSFSGQYTKPVKFDVFIENYEPSNLLGFIEQYLSHQTSTREQLIGFKETWCEEFAKFFVSHSCRCIFLIRDPRDVICSLDYGVGEKYGGLKKPLLFNIRNWRKSVLLAYELERSNMSLTLRYEDLISETGNQMRNLSKFLDIQNISMEDFVNGIKDQDLNIWKGNSSFEEYDHVSSNSVGRFKKHLPESISYFIEACCFFELKSMDYELRIDASAAKEIIKCEDISETSTRADLEEYKITDSRRLEELTRFENLEEKKFIIEESICSHAFLKLIN